MMILLDDVRSPIQCASYMHHRIGKLNSLYHERWEVVKDYESFVKIVAENVDKITHVSFDHDLADSHYENVGRLDEKGDLIFDITNTEKTGYDCAKWMKNLYLEKGLDLPVIFVHSLNPVGSKNIVNLFRY